MGVAQNNFTPATNLLSAQLWEKTLHEMDGGTHSLEMIIVSSPISLTSSEEIRRPLSDEDEPVDPIQTETTAPSSATPTASVESSDTDNDSETGIVIDATENDENDNEVETEVEECTICMLPLSRDEDVRRLACGHSFHTTCLGDWLSRTQSCPLCRAPQTTQTTTTAAPQPSGATANQTLRIWLRQSITRLSTLALLQGASLVQLIIAVFLEFGSSTVPSASFALSVAVMSSTVAISLLFLVVTSAAITTKLYSAVRILFYLLPVCRLFSATAFFVLLLASTDNVGEDGTITVIAVAESVQNSNKDTTRRIFVFATLVICCFEDVLCSMILGGAQT